ncbi:MAG: hypothetical protein HY704_09460 [Gemmatimonadetes bacterium]|nr:hypothetical protein [Gemmatimonadota bacterium]
MRMEKAMGLPDLRMGLAVLGAVSLLLPRCLTAQEQPQGGWQASEHVRFEPYMAGTISVVASGPRAGEAVFRALQAAEKISSGSIHGTASLIAMTKDGKVHRFANFGRGGTATLFISGEETGVPPPPEIAEAPIAAVGSTGPREPRRTAEPDRFPTAGDGIGFVVGHRLPSVVGRSGLPVNHEVFLLLQKGVSAREAVDSVMNQNSELDVGLIAVDRRGNVAMKNSALVDRRYDYGHARGEDRVTGAVVETIHNEIHPTKAVAQLVVDVALEVMTGSRIPDFQVLVRAGTKVDFGADETVVVDENLVAIKLTTSRRNHIEGNVRAVIPYIFSKVFQNGRIIGYTVNEPITSLENGIIRTLSTQTEMRVWVKKQPRICRYEHSTYTVCESAF